MWKKAKTGRSPALGRRIGTFFTAAAWRTRLALERLVRPAMPWEAAPKNEERKDRMGLRHVFWGAALVAGAMMGPGAYYMAQENEIVRTRVTGKVQADPKAEYPGQKYFIYTNQGKFDTYAISGGGSIREGCVYDFNLKSARFQLWPPSYSRSIKSFRPAPGGGCAPN
jgi:hypothetical protein